LKRLTSIALKIHLVHQVAEPWIIAKRVHRRINPAASTRLHIVFTIR